MPESAIEAPRNLRLKPEVHSDLAKQRAQLVRWVKQGRLTSDEAMNAYASVLAQVVRDPACLLTDDNTWSPVRCRRCNREQSVPAGISQYSCLCTPYIKRHLAIDLIGLDGKYAVDPTVLPVGA